MDQHQQPLPATCQDHQHQSGIDFSKMGIDSSQLQQASPTVERTSSDNPHLKLVLELKSPKTAKQQRKILQTLKSNPYLMAAFIKRQASSEGDHLSQFQEHINQQKWKSDMEELVKALTTTELEDTPVAAVADVAAEAHSKPSIKSLMRFGIQHSSRLHHQDHQTSSGVSQGSNEKDAQLNPDPDNDDLLLTELEPANPQETRKLSLQKFIQSLVHGYQCRDVNCCLPICQKWKMIDKHIKICKRGINENCVICKQITAYCYDHAKQCQESECPVPVCANIKHTMMQQSLRHKLEQTLLLQRLAGLSMSGVLPGPPFSIQEKAINSYILETLEKPKYQPPSFSQLTPHLPMPSSDGPLPIFRFTGMSTPFQQNLQVPPLHAPLFVPLQPVQQPPPEMVGTAYNYQANKEALHQVLEIMKTPRAPDHQQQVLHILDSNPQLKTSLKKQQQLFKQALLARARPLHAPSFVPLQPVQQPPSEMVETAYNYQANKEALCQLLKILKTPRAPDHKQQILHILDSNPQLKAAFKKQQQVFEQAKLARAQNQSGVEM